jgi:hypothetical protein
VLSPGQRVPDTRSLPLPTSGRRDATGVKGVGDGPQRRCAALLDLGDDRQDVRRMAVCFGLEGRCAGFTGR